MPLVGGQLLEVPAARVKETEISIRNSKIGKKKKKKKREGLNNSLLRPSVFDYSLAMDLIPNKYSNGKKINLQANLSTSATACYK